MEFTIGRRGRGSRPGLEGLEPRTLLSGPGSLDSSFGGGTGSNTISIGVPTLPVTALNYYSTRVESVATAPDGNIVVSGVITNTDYQTASLVLSVAEFNPDGSIDTSFGYGGQAQLPIYSQGPIPEGQDFFKGVAIQSNGQIIEASQTFDGGGNATYVAVRFNSNGSLDTNFGTNGYAEYPASTSTPVADRLGAKVGAVVLQPNGQIILAGSTDNADFAAVRLNFDGSLDTAYGQDGTVDVPVTANGYTSNTLTSAAIQANGQVVLAGTALNGMIPFITRFGTTELPATEAALVRLDANGSVDTAFGASGVVLLPPDPAHPSALGGASTVAVAVQPADQKIVVYSNGSVSTDATSGNTVYRLNTDGTLDSTFGTAGEVTPSLSGFNPDVIPSSYTDNGVLAIEPDGQIVVLEAVDATGSATTSGLSVSGTVVVRLNSDGTTDTTFGNTTTGGGYQPGLKPLSKYVSMTIDPSDSNILVAGSGSIPSLSGRIEGFSVASLLATTFVGKAASTLPPTPPASFDNSSQTNLAVYLPATGNFAYRSSGVPPVDDQQIQFGVAGAGQTIPAAADYQGSGTTQLAAYLPTSGVYAIQPTNGSPGLFLQFGTKGAGQTIPVPADYEGTGQADVAVYLTASGTFAILPSNGSSGKVIQLGTSGVGQSIPAPADYYGTGQDDVAVYLAASGSFAVLDPTGKTSGEVVPFGMPGLDNSIPVPGDYDGSGHVEFAVYIPSQGAFYYRPYGGGNDVEVKVGLAGVGEVPVVGDYDGSGRDEFAIYDPASGFFEYAPADDGPYLITYFGSANGGSVPVAEPAGALPAFHGSGLSSNAIRPNFVAPGSSVPASSNAITLGQASVAPAGPTLASARVALSLVNQGSDDSSKFTPV